MTFVMTETTLNDRQKIYSEDVIKKVKETGCRIDALNLEHMEKKWFVNEEESAYFCTIKIGTDRHGDGDSRWRYLLIVDNENIIFELKGFNTVIFLYRNDFLRKNLVKIKSLIANAFAVSGRWGNGDTDSVNAVPDPIFQFNLDAKE